MCSDGTVERHHEISNLFPNHSSGYTLFKFTTGLTWHENNGYTDTS